MTISPTTHNVQVQPQQAAQVDPKDNRATPQPVTVNQKATQTTPQPHVADTVRISGVAKKASEELTETPAQTATEARSGDMQAQRLMAREAAARAYQSVKE